MTKESIVNLVKKNITNSKDIISYIQALILYKDKVQNKEISELDRVNILSKLYKLSKDALLNSDFIDIKDRDVINKINSGSIPKDENDLAFKGEEFLNYVKNKIIDEFKEFINKRDGVKMGKAKKAALRNIC